MKCSDVSDQLDDCVARDLGETQTSLINQRIAEHIGECPACADLLEAVKALRAEVCALPREIDLPRDLWPKIETSINREKVIGFPSHRRHYLRAAAAAAVLIAAITGAYFVGLHQQTPLIVEVESSQNMVLATNNSWSFVSPSLQQTRSQLRSALEARKASLDPQTVSMVEENLEIIDRAISEISLALNETPDNPRLQRQLYFACSQEINLLRRAASFPAEI